MKQFKDYLKEESSTVYFTFGRLNPPTIGHEKLMDALATKSRSNPYKIYMSQSQDSKKNPLTYAQKVKHVRKMFPRHARSIVVDKNARTAFDVASKLYEQGYSNLAMVVGSDRVTEFKTLLDKYNGVKGRHGFYNFKTISVLSAGERDPDASGVEGMSASKQRENAANNNFVQFSLGLPKKMTTKDAKALFNDIRRGMNLKEESSFKNHITLEPVSETREKYVQGELFQLGEVVVIKETNEVGEITWLGSNYVVVKLNENKSMRKWLHDIERVEEGILSTIDPKLDRLIDRLFNKKSYNKAVRLYLDMRRERPGKAQQNMVRAAKVAGADYRNLEKTFHDMVKKGDLPKHLAFRKDLVAEELSPEEKSARELVAREKEANKLKHDRILDRAKMAAARRKSKTKTTEMR